jgi:glycosyltransferase involved in cell wall biosynthesis
MTGPVIPIVAAPPHHLRVAATWIVIANWGEAIASDIGEPVIFGGPNEISVSEVRARYSVPRTPGERAAARWRRTLRPLETSFKDLRAWARSRSLTVPALGSTAGRVPWVIQHHSLFFRGGDRLAARLDVPYVQLVESLQVWEARKWSVNRLPGAASLSERRGEWPQLRDAALVACVSQEVARSVEDVGVRPDRIVVVPNWAPPRQPMGPDERSALRSAHRIGDEPVIGWVGSFRPFHALDMLVDAYARLAASGSPARLVLVGDGQMRADIEERCKRVGVADRVTFTGAVTHEESLQLMQMFDVAVIPARSSDFHYSPLKLQEYLAAGAAVVAADVGDLSERIAEHGRGGTAAPGDLDGLVDALAAWVIKVEGGTTRADGRATEPTRPLAGLRRALEGLGLRIDSPEAETPET